MAIATLTASVRLVVVQFMMTNNRIPAGIPEKRKSETKRFPQIPGTEVLTSTKDVNLLPLIVRFDAGGNYELVDVWKQAHSTNWRMSVVRFVYCHKEHVKRDELFPDFVTKRDELAGELFELVRNNLWTVQGHLNPYFESNGAPSEQDVLMFGCVARNPDVEVYRDGRDPVTRQGIGPKVRLSEISSKLRLAGGEVLLESKHEPPKPEFDESVYDDDEL